MNFSLIVFFFYYKKNFRINKSEFNHICEICFSILFFLKESVNFSKNVNEDVDGDEQYDIDFHKITPEEIENIPKSSITADEFLAVLFKNNKAS